MKKNSKNKFIEMVKKNKNNIILVGVLVIVVVGLFIVSTQSNAKYFLEISYENDYQELIKADKAIVYFSNDDNMKSNVQKLASSDKISINYVDNKDNKYNANGNYIEVWSKGKLISSYDFKELETEDTNFNLTTVNLEQYIAKMKNSGLTFLIVGSSTCSHCSHYKQVIAETKNIAAVSLNYIDLSTISENDYYTLTQTDSYFTDNEWGTPTTMIYSNGQRVDYVSGYLETDDFLKIIRKNLVNQYIRSIA